MSVSLSPSSSLGFPRPLTRLVQRDLAISNHNAQPIAFKVKTTAPKLYCVRPNSGRVEPGETAVVIVMLQPLKDEPPLNSKCKDKFLIQSTIITPDKDTLSPSDLWNSPDTEGKIFQQKLRVVYLPAEGQTVEEEDESQVNMSSMMPSDSRFDTVRQVPINGSYEVSIPRFADNHRSGSPDFTAAPEEADLPRHESPPPVIVPPAPPSPTRTVPIVVAPPPVAPPVAPIPNPNIELQHQLSEANEEITRLRNLLATAPPSTAPPELRRRTRALSDDGSVVETDAGTVLDDVMVQPEGVPLQVVVIIALGVFITTYLFF